MRRTKSDHDLHLEIVTFAEGRLNDDLQIWWEPRMSFGIGVGDIIAISQLARGIWKNLTESTDQFKAIRTEEVLLVQSLFSIN